MLSKILSNSQVNSTACDVCKEIRNSDAVEKVILETQRNGYDLTTLCDELAENNNIKTLKWRQTIAIDVVKNETISGQ